MFFFYVKSPPGNSKQGLCQAADFMMCRKSQPSKQSAKLQDIFRKDDFYTGYVFKYVEFPIRKKNAIWINQQCIRAIL